MHAVNLVGNNAANAHGGAVGLSHHQESYQLQQGLQQRLHSQVKGGGSNGANLGSSLTLTLISISI